MDLKLNYDEFLKKAELADKARTDFKSAEAEALAALAAAERTVRDKRAAWESAERDRRGAREALRRQVEAL